MELLHQQGGRHPAEFQGPGGPQQLIPPVENARPIDPVGDLRLEARIALHIDGTRGKKTPVAEVPQPWGKTVAEQIEAGKMAGDTCILISLTGYCGSMHGALG